MIATALAAAARALHWASRALMQRSAAFADRERGDCLDKADVDFAAADADFIDALNCCPPPAAHAGPAATNPPSADHQQAAAGHTLARFGDVDVDAAEPLGLPVDWRGVTPPGRLIDGGRIMDPDRLARAVE